MMYIIVYIHTHDVHYSVYIYVLTLMSQNLWFSVNLAGTCRLEVRGQTGRGSEEN